jgi:hypothetical protein
MRDGGKNQQGDDGQQQTGKAELAVNRVCAYMARCTNHRY